jgi:periplasmic divalent cation tolerance protein
MDGTLEHVALSGTEAEVEVWILVTTVETAEQASQLGQAPIQQGLAACVQVEDITSYYLWDGQLQTSPEKRLVFKTTQQGVGLLTIFLKDHHPYKLPAIYAWPLAQVHQPYAQWVGQQLTRKEGSSQDSSGRVEGGFLDKPGRCFLAQVSDLHGC